MTALSMFVQSLASMQKRGDVWVTIPAMLALLNSCLMKEHADALQAQTQGDSLRPLTVGEYLAFKDRIEEGRKSDR